MPVAIPLVQRSLSSATRRCTSNGYKRVTRRTIFSLPDLSSLSPFSGSGGDSQNPQTYHESKILPYKPSDLYNIVTNVNSYPQFVPFCTDARVVATPRVTGLPGSPERINMLAELTVGFMSFKESYLSDVTCVPNQSVEAVASSSTPLFKSLSTVWRFQPASPRSPHLSRGSPLTTSVDGPQQKQTHPQTLGDSHIENADTGPTLVTLDLSFSFANPVHAAVSAAFFGQVSRMMVSAFEERCLVLYGPGTK